MGWARFDDGYMDHPKVYEAGPWAELLDRRAIEHCAKYETDGLVTPSGLKRISRGIPKIKDRVQVLINVGRWHVNESGGWLIHDFLKYNPSKAEKERMREQGRERTRKSRSRNTVTDAYQPRGGEGNTKEQRENFVDPLADAPKIAPPWTRMGMTRDEWNAAGCPEPPRLRAVGGSDA